MNPDKLFNYLDGKLSASERADFEARLISDPQLQRELAVARRIHAGMEGESREVLLPNAAVTARGRKMAWRVGVAFIILMAINVGAGLWIIAHQRGKNPNRKLLEQQTRDQITKSLEQAAASALPPAPTLDVSEVSISAAPGRLDSVADEIAAAAERLGGSATKGIPDQHHVSVLVDVPANREGEFRASLSVISGGIPAASSPNESAALAAERKSFVIKVVEQAVATPK